MTSPRDLSAEARSAKKDLDSAIDIVARQLTHVDDDPVLASRIVASLPERVTWFGWLVTSWAPRLAVLAIAAVTSMLLLNREQLPVTTAPLPSASTMVATALRPPLEHFSPGNLGTKPLEPLERLEPVKPQADHEFSLLALDVEALAPMNVPVDASLELAPLAIVDLPLSGESFPEERN
jgi:hypothetical protein